MMGVGARSGSVLRRTLLCSLLAAGNIRAQTPVSHPRMMDRVDSEGRGMSPSVHDAREKYPLVSSATAIRVAGEPPADDPRPQPDLDGLFPEGQLFDDADNCTGCPFNASRAGEPLPHAPAFQRRALVQGVVLSVIAALSVAGNAATLASILHAGRRGSSTAYLLLAQLAIADILVAAFCIAAEAAWTLTVQWYGGNALCKGVKFMQMFSLYLSTFLLVLIGFDRLCAVRFPMRRVRAKRHVTRGIVCVWSLSAVLSIPQVFVFSVMRGPFLEDFHQCVTYAFYTARWQERLYTSISLVLMFLIPLVVLVATYVATFATIASQDKTFLEHGVSSVIVSARHQFLHRAKMKSLMITVVIVLAFLVCWTPYYVTMIVFVFLEPDEQLGQDLQAAIFFFGSSTALLNPLIYGAFHLRRPGKPRRTASAPSGSGSSLVPTVRGSRATDRNRADTLEMRRANGGHGPCVLQQYPCQRGAWPDPTTGDPQQVCQ